MSLTFEPDSVRVASRANFIGGMPVETSGPRLPVVRPSDGLVYAEIPDTSDEAVDEAVHRTHAAWKESGWGTCAPRQRAQVLRRWADLIDHDVSVLGPLESVGSTRPIAETATNDVAFTAEGIRFFAEWADKLGGDFAATAADLTGFVAAEPYGVVAAIAPWNFPLSTASWKCGAALTAGNAVVFKPSELTPFSAIRFAELAVMAGLPLGILSVVNGSGQGAGRALVQHPLVGKITFTGSTVTGKRIMVDAAETGPKPVTLELGGKSPQLVFDDADLSLASTCIARSILGNAGQVCVAGTRIIAQRKIAEPLVAQIAALLGKIHPGPTWHETTTFSPIISEKQMCRIERIVGEAVAAGAECVVGGTRTEGTKTGSFYQPTVLTNVAVDSVAIREEIFGPVLTVQIFDDEDEGVGLAGHPQYGLAAGIYTADVGRALRAVRRIPAGTVWVNRYGRTHDFIMPTGGFNGSGMGKDMGRQSVEANLRWKSVLISNASPHSMK
jgi:aldehyde dehydrogenase (NAD+)